MIIQFDESTERINYLRGKILQLKGKSGRGLKSGVLKFMKENGMISEEIEAKNLKTVVENID